MCLPEPDPLPPSLAPLLGSALDLGSALTREAGGPALLLRSSSTAPPTITHDTFTAAANHRPGAGSGRTKQGPGVPRRGAPQPQRGQPPTPPLRCTAQRGMIRSLPPLPPHCALPQCLTLAPVPAARQPPAPRPCSPPPRAGEERRRNRGRRAADPGPGDRPTDRRVLSPGAGWLSLLLRPCPRAPTVRYSL